jgi:3-dehydroquinate synthase
MKRIDQKLSVSFDFPVIFTRGVFGTSNTALLDAIDRLGEEGPHSTVVFVDEGLAGRHPQLTEEITRYFASHPERLVLALPPQIVPGGEAIKNDFALAEKLARLMLDTRLSRHSFVIAIGGGAVLDGVGFAASLVHRGLRLVRLPTTVLSQNDGGVGVKNGINFAGQKNALGVFAPPFAVINDLEFLNSLDDRQWHEGIAEAFKVSIIRDKPFFDFLVENAGKLHRRDPDAMEYLVFRCAELHLDHIRTGGDPFEFGTARPLDFGHWSAHKLETMSNFRISHGEAVAVGVLLDSLYAVSKCWLTQDDFNCIRESFEKSGLPLWLDELEIPDEKGDLKIFEGIAEFQEHLGGKLCVTFPAGIGNRHEVHEIDMAAMANAIGELKKLAH